ncbi:hypothetical protein M433DRAFT_160805 [Acidomyces richmondensis BFW]|nr:hypothetical protein M433DRAFT_160805 [Acidomyces richmondensis BFW]
MLERNLKVLQINVNRSSLATEGALEYARDLEIDLIALTLLNIYNERDVNNIWTLDRTLCKLPILKSTILLEGFNIHYPVWEPSTGSPSPRAQLFKE